MGRKEGWEGERKGGREGERRTKMGGEGKICPSPKEKFPSYATGKHSIRLTR